MVRERYTWYIHYNDVIMVAMASLSTWPTVYSGADKETSKLCVTGLFEGKSPVTGQSPTQLASNAENVSIWWRYHVEVLKYHPCVPLPLTHWGRVTHICVSKLTIIASDNGLSPGRRQAIIWTSAGILLIWTLRNKLQWNFNHNSNIFIQENAFESVVWEMTAFLSRPQCVKCSYCNVSST